MDNRIFPCRRCWGVWLDFSESLCFTGRVHGCHSQLFPLHSCISEADTVLHVAADEFMRLSCLCSFSSVCFAPQAQLRALGLSDKRAWTCKWKRWDGIWKRKFYFGYLQSKDHSSQPDLEKPLKDRVDVQHVGHFHLNQTTHEQPASTTQAPERGG